MALITEIAFFDVTDAFRDTPELATAPLDIMLKVDGVHAPLYYGTQIENPSRGCIFINWDSYEAHMAFYNSSTHSTSHEMSAPFISGKIEAYHVEFPFLEIALESAVTGVLVFTLKAPENHAIAVDLLSSISEVSGKKITFGKTREDKNKYFVLSGWSTVEAHQENAKRPEVAEAVDKLFSLVDEEDRYHLNIAQYSGL